MGKRIEGPHGFTKGWFGPQDPLSQDENPETEGHGFKGWATEEGGEAEVEGHFIKDPEVEGHGVTPPPAARQDDAPEVEGHTVSFRRPIIRD